MTKIALCVASVAVVAAVVAWPMVIKAEGCCGAGGCGTMAMAATAPTSASAPAYVNTKCPIMGSEINPAKVTADLTRVYKGQKVAFCCGGCPAAWDKLTDAEKDAKLLKVAK